MMHNAELQFLRRTLASCQLNSLLLPMDNGIEPRMDLGLRSMIGWTRDYNLTLNTAINQCKPRTLYRMTDQFGFCYQFLQLPHDKAPILWLGPYLDQKLSQGMILEYAEQYGIDPIWTLQIERFISQIPIIPENSSIHAMLYQFCSLIWDNASFDTVDLNRELSGYAYHRDGATDFKQPEDIVRQMQIMEKRYRYENDLLTAVSQGQIQKASVMIGQLNTFIFEPRNPDALRNQKNYCIIMNTLLRKAAEHSGVHPIYLHQISAEYAQRIEQIYNIANIPELMSDMCYGYCRLVNRHATAQYSLPIQRVIAYIDNDLTADLSLSALAKTQNLSNGYLSTLFKKEVGMTLTEYVNNHRTQQAIRLLNSTNLQVQTIARLCGIPDTNYFSKLFKKHTKMTPLEFRKASSNKR